MTADPDPAAADRSPGGGRDDAAVIGALLERYLPSLTAYVERHAGAVLQQKESRSDLVQSVCREVLEDVRTATFTYRGEAEFRQWLFQAAMHKIQGRGRFFGAERRDAAREVRLDDLVGAANGDAGLAQSATPSRAFAAAEELARFRTAMAQLDEDSRRIVQLAYFDELPHKDVATRLGITEAHSRVLLSRALARIARLATGGST